MMTMLVGKRHLSYWEATGPEAFKPAVALPRRVDVLIVGVGLMGHWLAYFLSKAKPQLSVLILERDLLGYGASTRNAGFLSCGNISEWLMEMREQGEAATLYNFAARKTGLNIVMHELCDGLQTDPCGSADFDAITDEKTALMETFNAYLKTHREAPAFQVKRVMLAGAMQEVFFNAADHAINPVQLLGCLHEKLLQQGVRFGYGAEVTALSRGHAAVQLQARPVEVQYQYGFLCTNAFASDLYPDTHVRPGRGQILVTAPCELETTPMLGFLEEGYNYFRFVDGRLLVGGGRHVFGDEEITPNIETTAKVWDYLVQLASRISGSTDIDIGYHWAGLMGFPDGAHGSVQALECATMLDERTEVLAGLGGWGITVAPYLARKKADLW